jgi:hypothetical protein
VGSFIVQPHPALCGYPPLTFLYVLACTASIESIPLDERRTVMADKVPDLKKQSRISAQTEKLYEEYRKEQEKNISGPGAALLGQIRDTVKRLDAVIGELNDLRNAVGMSEIFLLANTGVYDHALQSRGGKARAAKLSPAQRTGIARKAVEARWAKKKGRK